MPPPGQPPAAASPAQGHASNTHTPQPAAAQGAAAAPGHASSGEPAKPMAEKAHEMVVELQTLCGAWFARVRGGLEEPYDVVTARQDQEKIMSLFTTLSEELRKSGLENLLVDKKIKTANGEDVQLPHLPKHILAKKEGVDSLKMIGELKTMIGSMTEDLDALHSVAERASRSLSAVGTPAG